MFLVWILKLLHTGITFRAMRFVANQKLMVTKHSMDRCWILFISLLLVLDHTTGLSMPSSMLDIYSDWRYHGIHQTLSRLSHVLSVNELNDD